MSFYDYTKIDQDTYKKDYKQYNNVKNDAYGNCSN